MLRSNRPLHAVVPATLRQPQHRDQREHHQQPPFNRGTTIGIDSTDPHTRWEEKQTPRSEEFAAASSEKGPRNRQERGNLHHRDNFNINVSVSPKVLGLVCTLRNDSKFRRRKTLCGKAHQRRGTHDPRHRSPAAVRFRTPERGTYASPQHITHHGNSRGFNQAKVCCLTPSAARRRFPPALPVLMVPPLALAYPQSTTWMPTESSVKRSSTRENARLFPCPARCTLTQDLRICTSTTNRQSPAQYPARLGACCLLPNHAGRLAMRKSRSGRRPASRSHRSMRPSALSSRHCRSPPPCLRLHP